MIIGTYRDDCDSGLYDFPVDDLQQLWSVFYDAWINNYKVGWIHDHEEITLVIYGKLIGCDLQN